MNAVHLTGRLTRDPELRHAADKDVCRMRLAVDGPKDSDTTFVDVTAFGALAGNCGEYLSQGRAVAISGRLAYREWETDDGARRSKHEIVAGQVDFLPGGRGHDPDTAGTETA